MLITMLLTLSVFSAGYIAAYNDWAAFAKVILDFSNFEHKVVFVACLVAMLISYGVIILIPAILYADLAEKNFLHRFTIRAAHRA